MSLATIINSIGTFVSKLFNELKDEEKVLVPIALKVGEAIKSFDDSIEGQAIEKLIPDGIGEDVHAVLQAKLPQILAVLKLIDTCANAGDENAVIACAIKNINGGTAESKAMQYLAIGSNVLTELSNQNITWSSAVKIIQETYDEVKAASAQQAATTN